MTKIAFLGLGAMGSRMAARLLDAGYSVTVNNRSIGPTQALAARGAQVADTPREAAQKADVVMSMVTNDEAAHSIWLDPENGAFAGVSDKAIVIESSTLSLQGLGRIETEATGKGVNFLAAPVVGTRPHAESGQLTFLAGGAEDVLNGAKPVLQEMGANILHFPTPVAGMAMKLAVNSLFAIQVSAFAEILVALEQAGINREEAAATLSNLPVTSPVAARVLPLLIQNGGPTNFPVALVEKDLRYGLQVAATNHQPTLQAVHGLFEAGKNQGLADHDISGIIKLYAAVNEPGA